MIADPDQALKAVGLKNRKQRFSEGGHSAGCFVPFRLRNSSVVSAQLRIFIRNRWLKSIVCAAIEVIWLLYLLLLLFFFFFLICFGIGLKCQKT